MDEGGEVGAGLVGRETKKDEWVPKRLFNVRFVHLVCIESILQFGLYAMNPIVSNYAVVLGSSVAVAGFVAGLNALASIIARPMSGAWADVLNKKSLLIVSCALFAVAAFGCALSRTVGLLAFFRAVQGLSFAFKSVVVMSMASLVVPRESVGSGVGLLGLAFTVACALGPSSGAALAAIFGYSASFLFAGALFALGFVLCILFRVPACAGSHRGELRTGKRDRAGSFSFLASMFHLPVMPYACVMALMMFPQGMMNSMLFLAGELEGSVDASIYYFVYAFVALIGRPVAGRMSDRVGLFAVVVPFSLVTIAGMLALATSFSTITVIFAGICMGGGLGAVFSAIQAECVRGVPDEKVGRAANTFYLGTDVGMGVGPFACGFVLDHFGVPQTFVFCAFSVAVALGMFAVFDGVKRKRTRE